MTREILAEAFSIPMLEERDVIDSGLQLDAKSAAMQVAAVLFDDPLVVTATTKYNAPRESPPVAVTLQPVPLTPPSAVKKRQSSTKKVCFELIVHTRSAQ